MTADSLSNGGIDASKREAQILIEHVSEHSLAELILHPELTPDVEAQLQIAALTERRLQGEPVQYVIGQQDFFGITLNVDRRVLIPRPETEVLVEAVLRLAPPRARVLDLCTGSGCIALALAKERQDLQLIATDISSTAIAVARENASRLGLSGRVQFLEGDLWEALPAVDSGQAADLFTVIVSNPPYIPTSQIPSLQPEVSCFEPLVALDGGVEGLSMLRRIHHGASRYLAEGGILLLEIGDGQADSVEADLRQEGFQMFPFIRDLRGVQRIAYAVRPNGLNQKGT